MRRFLACVLSIALAVGLVPAFAIADEVADSPALDGGRELSATNGSLTTEATVEEAEATVEATFKDANLYDALVAQLDEQGVGYTADASARTVALNSAEAAKVTGLNLGFVAITDLTGIEGLADLPNLTRLDLSHNSLTGSAGAPLEKLVNLTYLDLNENKLDDWTFLGSLTNLKHLDLGLNKRGGTTREALKKLTKLEWLDFSFPSDKEPEGSSYNYIIDCVSPLTSLEYLDLCGWSSKLVGTEAGSAGIGNLTNLKTLVFNYNYAGTLTALLPCTNLEELHLAYNRVYWSNEGANCLISEDGTLKLPHLKKLDLWGQESRATNINRLENADSARKDMLALYRLHKQGKLELGYDYRWIDELVQMEPRLDSTGASYISYEDFGTYKRAGSDDWDAMRNAHAYANEHGCEVRSVVGEGPQAAQNVTYHIYRLYDRSDYFAYTNVDWQGATIVVHDENFDWHYSVNRSLLIMRPSPDGFTSASMRPSANTRTFETEPSQGSATLTINADKLPMARGVSNIKGLSPEVDATIAELNDMGYSRYYVQFYDANTLRYARGYNYDYQGNPQWDALIVDGDGAVVRQNAAKLAGDETPSGSYIPEDPEPLQWQFDGVTKIVVAPIADTPAHIENARFITMPFNSKQQLPKSRWGTSYRRNLDISGTNFEVSNITQTVGTAEGGYDNGNYSGLYVGFIDLKDCAELYMHDVATWQRVCTRSTYGINTTRICRARFKDVGDSNPGHPAEYRGGHGNHGGNYAKHMLWEGIYLGRIDQHTGCYDMAVRDSTLHNLALTGAGPLTVERTTVTGGSFINLRADYGSTWDGVANVIDCVHYPLLGSTGEPDCFAASTPDLKKDFGYKQRFPELHVKNFTIDCSRYYRSTGTRYRITYGIAANHVNGLNLLDNYWPDTVEVDGLEVKNWRNTIGYELHTLMPLYMQGKPAERSRLGAWTLENVTYDGVPFVPASDSDFEGDDELVNPKRIVAGISKTENGKTTVVREREVISQRLTDEQSKLLEENLEDSDIVVTYTGDEPRVLLRVSGSGFANSDASWTSAYPYLVEHRGDVDVAYYSGREYLYRRSKIKESNPTVGAFYHMNIYAERIEGSHGEAGQDGVTDIQHVRLVKTRCQHDWNDPVYTWSADNSSVTARAVCKSDDSHVIERTSTAEYQVTKQPTATEAGIAMYTAEFSESPFATQVKTVEIPATGPHPGIHEHDWGDWSVVKASTCTEPGVERRTCSVDGSHVEEREVSALGHDWGAWAVASPCTDTEDGLLERSCSRCGESQQKALPAGTLYFEYAGAGAIWSRGSAALPSFTFKRVYDDAQTFSHFRGVKVDGADVDPSDYDAAPGSVVVTLHADYLDGLGAGDHVVQALFDDGNDPVVAFTVQERQASTGERPGDQAADDAAGGGSSGGSAAGEGAGGGAVGDGTAGGSSAPGVGASAGAARSGAPAGSARPAAMPSVGDPLAAAVPLALALAAASALACALARRRTTGT